MAPWILIFSIVMDADNAFYVKFIGTEAPTFSGYNISVLAMVGWDESNFLQLQSMLGGAVPCTMVKTF